MDNPRFEVHLISFSDLDAEAFHFVSFLFVCVPLGALSESILASGLAIA